MANLVQAEFLAFKWMDDTVVTCGKKIRAINFESLEEPKKRFVRARYIFEILVQKKLN